MDKTLKVILASAAKVNGNVEPAGKELTVSFDIAAQLRSAGALADSENLLQDAVPASGNTTIILSSDGDELILQGDIQELAEQVNELTEQNEALEIEVLLREAAIEKAAEVDRENADRIVKLEAEIAKLTEDVAVAEQKIIAAAVEVAQLEARLKSASEPPVDTVDEPVDTKPAKATAKAASGKVS